MKTTQAGNYETFSFDGLWSFRPIAVPLPGTWLTEDEALAAAEAADGSVDPDTTPPEPDNADSPLSVLPKLFRRKKGS